MDLGVEGRVALVAASTGGLGLAVATSLAAEGARVVVTGRDLERARSVAATLPGATAFHLDLGVPGAPAETVDRVTAELGSVEILVTNGPGPKPKLASDTSAEDLSEAIDGLLLPQQRLIASVLPGMVKLVKQHRKARMGRNPATGEAINLDRILLVANGDDVKIGLPVVEGAKVTAEVVSHGRRDKVRIIKFRRRKHHMKRQGHRQWFTEVKITGIQG